MRHERGSMTNKEVVDILEEIALLLELAGESPFKSRAYTNVARRIEQLDGAVADLVEQERLREIQGVGEALEKKITELVTTGALGYHADLRARFPESLFDLFTIPGLGPKRIKAVYDELGIQSLEQLEEACSNGALSKLKGFGPKMLEKIVDGIAFAKEHQGLHLLNEASDQAMRLKNLLAEHPATVRIDIAGSLRRCKEVVHDADLIASSSDPEALMKCFVEDAEVKRVTNHGATKSSVVLNSGLSVDLRVVSDVEYPFALAHFTGSKDHNVAMRQRAKEKSLKLNEYGLFDGDKTIACTDEAALYAELDLAYIPPELREDMGEFDVESMPALIELDDLAGMIHCHSTYSDGRNTIEEMALATRERGYGYLTMTDHSQSAAYAGGLGPEKIEKQHAEIDALNEALAPFRILKGIESDIRSDGSLDYDEDILKSFDLIIASVHNKLDMPEDEATKRVIKAVENPYTTILGHPTGRLLLARAGYPLDFEKLFDACAANGVAIEINANCHRLDLDWRHVRRAKEKGVKLSIGPDAHAVKGLDNMIYGVGIARKGWLEAGDVLNAMPLDAFETWCAKRG